LTELNIKPPLLTQVEEFMKDKNPDDYMLVFNNLELAFIFSHEPVNGTIMQSIHNKFVPEGQLLIVKKNENPYGTLH
jgi:hypothetical protein